MNYCIRLVLQTYLECRRYKRPVLAALPPPLSRFPFFLSLYLVLIAGWVIEIGPKTYMGWVLGPKFGPKLGFGED